MKSVGLGSKAGSCRSASWFAAQLAKGCLLAVVSLGCSQGTSGTSSVDTSSSASELDTSADLAATDVKALAQATIGPEGGTLEGGGFALTVPPGALTSATLLRIEGPLPQPVGPTWRGPVVRFEPSGLTFLKPAVLTVPLADSILPTGLFWSRSQDPTTAQQLPITLVNGTAVAKIYHFSYLFLIDPTLPAGGQWGCCTPIDPTTHTNADCILNIYNNVTCDPDICNFVPGSCTPPQGACCSAINPNNDLPWLSCAALPSYNECLLSAGSGYCQWNGSGPGCAVPPQPSCADCSAAQLSNPAFAQSYQLTVASAGSMACGQLMAAAPPQIPLASTPVYWSLLGKWCGFQAALAQQCGQAGCAPIAAPTCSTCTAAQGAGNAMWNGSYATAYPLFVAQGCSALQQFTPPVPPTSDPGYQSDLAKFCAHKAALQVACSPPPASACSLNPPPAPGPTCSTCTAAQGAGNAMWNGSYATAYPLFVAQGCIALQQFTPPVPPTSDPGYQSDLAKFCAHKAALQVTCSPPPAGACSLNSPAPTGPCGACLTQTLSSQSGFQTGASSGWAAYSGMNCTSLGQQNLPVPPAASDPSYLIQLGRWCTLQFLLEQAGCGQGQVGPQSACAGQLLCTLKPPPCP